MRKVGHITLAGVLALGVAVTVAALVAWNMGQDSASADTPHAGLDFAIGVRLDAGSADVCDTTGALPAKCDLQPGDAFDLRFYLPGRGGLDYEGYDGLMNYSGVENLGTASGTAWPECDFFATDFTQPGEAAIACAAFEPPTSTYTGLLATIDFQCPAGTPVSGLIEIRHGPAAGDTGLTAATVGHGEGEGTLETLNINCGAGTPDTPTPAEPTFTPTPCPPEGCPTEPPTNTPTNTPTRTATRTPTSTPVKECGDVDDDGEVNSIDALLILQVTAGLLDESDLENAPSGDGDGDGQLTSIDASLVLQVSAGVLDEIDC